MYSDDEGLGMGGMFGGRSPTPDGPRLRSDAGGGGVVRDRSRSRGGARGRSRSRSGARGGGGGRGGGGRGKGGGKSGRPRTTGRELPRLNSIHRASVASIQSYGAFVRLGDGGTYKDGLLHVSRITSSGRVEAVTDILSEGDAIWVKVSEVNDEAQKYSVDMRFVRQKDGEDLDPNNTQADSGKGSKGGGRKPEPIRIGAVLDATCSRCGARGHLARECFAGSGANYKLLEEVDDEPPADTRASKARASGDDAESTAKAALQALLRRRGAAPESDSDDDKGKKVKKKDKQAKKDEKKKQKKEKKKQKKEKKKQKKKEKKAKKEKAKKKGKGGSKQPEEGSLAAVLAAVSSSSSSDSSSS